MDNVIDENNIINNPSMFNIINNTILFMDNDEEIINNMNITADEDIIYEDFNQKETNRYVNIIYILGLNIYIDYPIKVLTDGIIELHTTHVPDNNIVYSYYAHIYKFKENKLSQKLKSQLFGDVQYRTKYSYKDIKNMITNTYKLYRYNTIINNKTIKKDSTNTQTINKLGFNYEYSRWVPLTSYEIE